MKTNLIYAVGEMLILNELNVVDVTYPKGENPAYCIVELKSGIKN